MRLLHTSDWHLGQTLRNVDRTAEHAHFLRWLVRTLDSNSVDVLVVAGDVFDTAHPSSSALGIYFDFLAEATDACPQLEIVVVAGNHDSGMGMDAPARLLRRRNVHVVGALPRNAGGNLDLDRLLIPVHNAQRQRAGIICAVPFLRPQYLGPAAAYDAEVLAAGVRSVYSIAVAEAVSRRKPGEPLIATGHAYFAGTTLSPDSERQVQCGNQFALPTALLPDELTYVALGHLHLAQKVGGYEHIRYCGSPLPLGLSERTYPHQVRLVDFDAGTISTQRSIRVPRLVEIIRLPEAGSCTRGELFDLIGALPTPSGPPPYLDIEVKLSEPEPQLGQLVDAAVGKRGRVLRLRLQSAQSEAAESLPASAQQITPEDLFRLVFQRQYADAEPTPTIQRAFLSLVEEAQRSEAAE